MMNELTIMAVGSSPLVAGEITGIATSLLPPSLKLASTTTRAVTAAERNTLYVCANTQGERLARVLSREQLYVFELEPITTFFLALARIPAGTTVYIFNNLLAYTELLARRCHELGLTELDFQPIAYEEMAEGEVAARLARAKYIIGVDIFVGEAVLQSERYKKYLAPDVTIIAGRRTASVASANRLLAAIASHYYREASDELGRITLAHTQGREAAELNSRLTSLIAYLGTLTHELQQSVLRTVTTQVVGSVVGRVSTAFEEESYDRSDCRGLVATAQSRLRQLALLREKINKLAH